MKTKTKTSKTRLPVYTDTTDLNVTEFHVYYSVEEHGQWDHDGTFSTLAEAEAYCRKKSHAYATDEDDEIGAPWEFYIYETKCVRVFRGKVKRELILEEQ
jgi:hypothetical protein